MISVAKKQLKNMKKYSGFAIIEILIAVAILSITLLSIISGISAGISAIAGNKNLTRAMIVAKNRLNEFQLLKMRGPDIDGEPVAEYPGFFFTRYIKRYDNEIFGPIPAKKVEIIIKWKEREIDKKYSISYVYPEK